jgi:hypothetical protein
MKLGYPDTINNKAYQGETSVSPFKMVDKSKADLDKDGKVSEYESKRAGAAFGSEAPLNYSPIKADSAAYTKLKAANKAAAEKAKKAEAAIRKKESADKSSEPATKPARKKTMLGRAIAARKKRRNDGENDNPKAEQREIGRRTRKENAEQNKLDVKTEKAKVTKARQDKRTAKATARQTKRLNRVTKKVVEKVEDVKKGTGLGISKNNPAVGNVVKNIVTAKNKKKKK